ncbi:hypothetical protein DFH09DRAFT_1413808, partial [Mycena vulgaris]
AHLEHALTPQQLFNELTPFISNRADEILKRTQLPNLVTNAQGVLVLDGWLENSAAKSLASIVMEDCVVYAFRVISITEAAALKVELKFTKKKALQQQADVTMADATKPGPALVSLITKVVRNNQVIQKPNKGKGNNGKKAKAPGNKPPFKPGRNPKTSKQAPKAKASKGGKPQQKGKGKAK